METGQTRAIANRAYQIWEREGRPDGKDMDHWLQAEREVAAEGKRTAKTGRTPRKTAKTAAASAKPKATRSRAPRKPAGSTKS